MSSALLAAKKKKSEAAAAAANGGAAGVESSGDMVINSGGAGGGGSSMDVVGAAVIAGGGVGEKKISLMDDGERKSKSTVAKSATAHITAAELRLQHGEWGCEVGGGGGLLFKAYMRMHVIARRTEREERIELLPRSAMEEIQPRKT